MLPKTSVIPSHLSHRPNPQEKSAMTEPEEWEVTHQQLVTAIVYELRQPLHAVMDDALVAARVVEGAMVDMTRAITRFRHWQNRIERQVDALRWLPVLLRGDQPAMPKPVPRRVATAVAAVARSTPRLHADVPSNLRVLVSPGVFDVALFGIIHARRHGRLEEPITISARSIDPTQQDWPAHTQITIAGPAILLTIADEGPQIPRDIRPHLFRPFHRRRKGSPSLGIGLWLSRRLVRAHGGDLWLDESAPGATFLSVWPAAPEGRRHTQHKDILV
jgi:K+-sensing histidine kinase KdpD